MTRWAMMLGHAQYFRGKGASWIETFRPWILPVLGGAGVGKYLGLPTGWAVAAAVAIPLVTEILAIWLGFLEHRSGAVEAHYRLAAESDPYRAESLALLRAILARLETIGRRRVNRPTSALEWLEWTFKEPLIVQGDFAASQEVWNPTSFTSALDVFKLRVLSALLGYGAERSPPRSVDERRPDGDPAA